MNEEKLSKSKQGYNQQLHDIAFGKTNTFGIGESTVKPNIETAKLEFNSQGKAQVHPFLKPAIEEPMKKETVKLWRKVGVKRMRRVIVDICDKEVVKQTLARLMATKSYIVHPRTKEIIYGVSGLAQKRIPRSKTRNLRAVPRVNYNTRTNQRLTNGCFVIVNGKIKFRGNTKLDTQPHYEPTKQYKTVWYSKGMRRQ